MVCQITVRDSGSERKSWADNHFKGKAGIAFKVTGSITATNLPAG